MTAELFDSEPLRVAPEDPATPQERRMARMLALQARGQHPLAGPLNSPIRLHPDAPPVDDQTAPGPRCGDCIHRKLLGYHARDYPKCLVGATEETRFFWELLRVSNGEGTDVRRYWPACTDFTATP